ncbi:RagB/SusD family nutrient uptake outer membrane protein [Seonamhaeicola sp. ML3]|uniref:RagB/SusD family nutrient uptake outer membrane protein n=1 Tax=Seonamhaeicola sp. ML3 TaxID=2937786 RepID=UPI00200DC00E|nr:RagB/SusD family nutrient uptake outer membrane protein [Seonamhaeicola sp. ML3]
MKNIKFIIIILLAGVILSCSEDYLNPIPSSGITSASYYKNADEVETALISIYDGIQGINSTSTQDLHAIQFEYYLTEMRSDNTRTKSQEGEAAQFEFYNVEANNGIVSNYYGSFFNVIMRANVVLDNLSVIDNADQLAAFEAEAKFLRAYAYFNLVRLFGDLPLIDSVITPLDKEIQFTRQPVSEIYSLIEGDLETAVAGLDNSYKTRASKAAAQALLAKVYLTHSKNYSAAQGLCEDIIGSGFSLMTNFNDVFYSERNDEIIFAIGFESGLTADSQNFSAEFLNGVGRTVGVNYVTQDAAAALDNFGGDRAMYSYRIDPFQVSQRQVTKYLPDGKDGGADGKTFEEGDPRLAGNDWIVLRYADVLLMHVEAIMAGAAETSSSNALTSFNEVRNRAGLDDDEDGTITVEELLLERRVELAFENQRLFDLIRLGQAETVLSQFSADNGLGYSSTDLLLPIPQREINLSQGLMSQNPGY